MGIPRGILQVLGYMFREELDNVDTKIRGNDAMLEEHGQ